jgi:hypothetical protein
VTILSDAAIVQILRGLHSGQAKEVFGVPVLRLEGDTYQIGERAPTKLLAAIDRLMARAGYRAVDGEE